MFEFSLPSTLDFSNLEEEYELEEAEQEDPTEGDAGK